ADAPPAVERYPEPKLQPTTWELKLRLGTPKRIAVRTPGQDAAKAYWYLPYTVTNLGEDNVEFDPVIEMLIDGKTIRANRALPSEVFDAIKRKEGNKLLTTAQKIVGTIKPGDDQARDGVAIWPEPQARMGTFTVFFAGLSGETVTVKKVGDKFVPIDPTKAADELKDVKEEDRRNLRKQFSVTYRVLGDEVSPGTDPVQKRSEQWVMRD
ncbi:MAG: hypothetical protein JWO31_4001, partial [Phycisphaerales bacterium]|nr:hypothetical protein [Phycisphaerales bacterium]